MQVIHIGNVLWLCHEYNTWWKNCRKSREWWGQDWINGYAFMQNHWQIQTETNRKDSILLQVHLTKRCRRILPKCQMTTFCIAMDNYFTLPGIILRNCVRKELVLLVHCTAQFKRNWPPKELKRIEMKKILSSTTSFIPMMRMGHSLQDGWTMG